MSAALTCRIVHRVTGHGPLRVLLLHALTGGPEAADRTGVQGWWGPLFREGAPLADARATVWTPNLPGSCYGSVLEGPESGLGTREQAGLLAQWMASEGLAFDVVLGGSLGGMVALELAVQAPERVGTVGVIGCGARADAWLWGTNEVQRAILLSARLGDAEAIALARRAAMLTFRTPEGLNARFADAPSIRGWLAHHGDALAARFTRRAYLALLNAMDAHDLGRGRGGCASALQRMRGRLHVLGMDPDYLFPKSVVADLGAAAEAAGVLGSLSWIEGPHGHDAFLIDWRAVTDWVERVCAEVAS